MNFRHTFFAFLILSIGFFSSCDKSNNNDDQFDREAMVANLTDNLIVPRYEILNTATTELRAAIQAFLATPSESNLATAQNKLLAAQLAWQACSSFEFGPAGMQILRTAVNTFPVDTPKIQLNITNGSYNLDDASNIDTKGFPALDYLLFGTGNSQTGIVQYYQNSSQNLHAYAQDITDHLQNNINDVYNEWKNSYAADFKTKTGTDVGSALGMLVNDLNLDFENFIRDGKVGIPLGVRSLGTPLPEKTEAYYSGNSLQLAIESIEQLKDLYLGNAPDGTTGIGLDDYLEFLGAQHSSGLLSDKIEAQFNEILIALNDLNDPLSAEVINNESGVQIAYDKMQQLIVLLKVDISSALGVLITYQDNDGD